MTGPIVTFPVPPDVGLAGEHYSLQRHVVTLLFPGIEVQRRYTQETMPQLLVILVSSAVQPGGNSYITPVTSDYVLTYYANDFDDAERAMDLLQSLGAVNESIPLFNTKVNPPVAIQARMRVETCTVHLLPDLDDDSRFSVTANLEIKSTRATGKYSGGVPVITAIDFDGGDVEYLVGTP